MGEHRSVVVSFLSGERLLSNGGEFESLFGNAWDIWRRKSVDGLHDIPFQLYLSDFFAAVPSQLLPFEKMDYATWYLTSFYPEIRNAGGGLAFGVVPQAILGFGLPELAIRAAALGVLYAWLRRYSLTHANMLWPYLGYLWLTACSYQSFL